VKEYETPKLQKVEDLIEAVAAGEPGCKNWNFDREFDPMAFRIVFHSLRQAAYNDIEAIRVWKCAGGDESVRSVCYYLDSQPEPGVKDIHFVDNGVTPLGCEFLARTLGPNGNKTVVVLCLDFNQFGTPGIEKLSMGLAQNAALRKLSLRYCGIGEDGGQYIAQILMFHRNALEILQLRGNYLRERGAVDVLNGARRTRALAEIDLFDNKFTDTPDVIKALRDLFANNTSLVKYHLEGNQISDAGASMLVNGMIGHSHLQEVNVTERCSGKTFEALKFQLGAGGGKKKKGKKK
jgi:Ran GTPase-activating protein (RanGAP) involved in mRNA processing and transport